MTDPRFVDRPLDPRLSEQQRLTLVRLMEECAEVQKAAAKILRFGLNGYHPDDASFSNIEMLNEEWHDLLNAMDRFRAAP
jgi:serine/threonine protein phosphatase PrpC